MADETDGPPDDETPPDAVAALRLPGAVRTTDRRRFLGAVGVGVAGLAGCLGDSESPDSDGNETSDNENPPDTDGENGNNSSDNGSDDGNGGDGTDDGNDENDGDSTDDEDDDSDESDDEPERRERPFRVGPSGFEIERDGEFEPLTVRGVNIGMGLPGRFPGEAAITREQYDRWLAAIGELGANTVRVYTIHPPAFYRALAAYNRGADDPIYLFQGTWIPAADLHDAESAHEVSERFRAELRRTVDVVHGETTLEKRPGHASGSFDADVSNYLLGYIPGIEWPPAAVVNTNENEPSGTYIGRYVTEDGGAPFERWLAESLDHVATYAQEEYGTRRPLSFVNWPTTDPLSHPYEPFEVEDRVAVDPDSVVATEDFDAGVFATYHVYPYYPPFIRHTPRYREYVDHRGERNTYAGYLDHLTSATDQPILVGEFGVPDSRALAAKDPSGRHQGRHTEREQGEIVAGLYEDVVAADTAGGLAFAWQDEWFKRTWNMAEFSNPDRRPFWLNVQTPEERFGLLTFDPADRVSLDGSAEDWADATRFEPQGAPAELGDGATDQRTLTSVAVTHDAAYLSVRVEFESLSALDWSETNVLLALSHTGRGNTSLPLGTDAGAVPTDFLVRLAGPDDSRLQVDAYYDAFAFRFNERAGLDLSTYQQRDSGRFVPSRVSTTSGYTLPATEERIPFEAHETGRLRYGNGNPGADDYDSLADVYVDRAGDAIELRVPWLLLNVADPSTRLALGDFWANDEITFEEFDAISIGAATYAPDTEGMARTVDGPTNLVHAAPGIANGRLQTADYTWETWRIPEYEERRKESYSVLQQTFREFAAGERDL